MIVLFVLTFFSFLLYMVLSVICLIQQELEIKDLLEDLEELRRKKNADKIIDDSSTITCGDGGCFNKN